MKRNLIGTLALVALSMVLTAGAHAQAVAKAAVPFAFRVGNSQLQAGTYVVTPQANNSNVVSIRNDDSGASVIALARTEYPHKGGPRLVFHRIGSQYFLAQIWGTEGNVGMGVPTSKLEKEMQLAKSSPREEVVIALKF